MSNGQLRRSETDQVIAGVCGGIAAYLDIDSVLVRLAFIVLLFASGIGLPIYFILWVIMPREAEVGQSGTDVMQKNIEEMGATFSKRVNRLGRPGTIGVLLILFGVYFMLEQFGWLGWMSSGVFWSLALVGLGVYLLIQRTR